MLPLPFAKSHTPRAAFAYTISVSDAPSLSCSTPLGRPLSTDISDDTSHPLQPVRHGMPALTRTLKNQCHHYHFPMNLPEMVKEGGKGHHARLGGRWIHQLHGVRPISGRGG
uniref:Uncharacterized protein n=1 Tax=Eutreptiella gymnastica TaxID=73025 RepID=A0A7S4CVK0_9EUGL